jgi:hypothetical protein
MMKSKQFVLWRAMVVQSLLLAVVYGVNAGANPILGGIAVIVDNEAPTRIISLSGNMEFGNVAVATSAQSTLNIANNGNSTLTVSSISYPIGFSGDWSLGAISAGGSQNVTVTFSPNFATSYGGTVTVFADQTSGANTLAVSGTGTSVGVQVYVTASAGTGGTISPSGTITKNAGDSQAFTASPNSNYAVNQWLVDGNVVQASDTAYTLYNIQANLNVQVTFNYVGKATATVTLGNLSHVFDGTAKTATATTIPPGLRVNVTYDGSPSAPVNTGNYTVVGTVDDPNYQGSATNTLVIADTAVTPTITLQRSTNLITLVWPTNGFKLQSSPVLPATNWQDVAGSETTNSLRVAIGASNQFYRLKK